MEGYQLTAFQKRTWVLQNCGYQPYNQVTVTICGPLDREVLKQALARTVAAHDILRTAFTPQPGNIYPVQVIGEAYEPLIHEDVTPVFMHGQPLHASLSKGNDDLHTLKLSLPSMASDIPAMMIVLNDICKYYQRLSAGQAPADEEENVQFTQFSEWQNELKDEPDEEGIAYWKRMVHAGLQADLSLPFELQASVADKDVAVAEVALDASTIKAIENAAASADLSVENFLFSCWNALLWHYAGQPESMVTGKTQNGRYFDVFEKIAGPLFKILPFQTRPSATTRFIDFARALEVEAKVIDGWQEYFNWKKDNAGQGLEDVHHFAAAFEYNRLPASILEAGHTSFAVHELYSCNDVFKLKLLCTHWEETLKLQLYYQPAILDEHSILCIKKQFAGVLDKAVATPDITLENILQAAPEEVLAAAPAPVGLPAHHTVLHWFESTVTKHGERTALKYGEEKLSCAALDRLANRIANHLIAQYGIQKGDIIMLRCGRNEKMVPALLGIMKTGAAYLPVDHTYPPARLKFIMEDSGAKLLLTDKFPAQLELDPNFCVLLNDDLLQHATDDSNPWRDIGPDDPVYVIYTSGSTGQPKGVVIGQRSLVNYLSWFTGSFSIGVADETILFASIAFDLCYTSLWSAIVCGCTLHIVQDSEFFDPAEIHALLQKEPVSYVKITPSQFSLLMNDPAVESRLAQHSLRLILLGGEPPKVAEIEQYLAVKPATQFVNHYGPTETTIGVIACPISLETVKKYKAKPVVGKPVTNNTIYILKDGKQLQPTGITGEICVSGKGLAIGYLNRDQLTSEKFIDNPVEPGQRLYCTGDLGRLLPDGTIELLGRSDFQVKIRGYRVELGEIEKVLNVYDGIEEAIVLPKKDQHGEQYLVAYLQTQEPPVVQQLRQFLKEQLPDFMVPAKFLNYQKFPLLPNGKTNRKALMEEEGSAAGSQVEYIPPATEVERQLVAIWENILGVTQVGIHDNFFDHGGNSLRMIQMLRKLSDIYPGKISLTDLFKYNTVSSIAAFLGQEEVKSEAIETFEV
jgi:amino acid adenylation domain-containing protein